KESDFLMFDLRSPVSVGFLETARAHFQRWRSRESTGGEPREGLQGEKFLVETGAPAQALVSHMSLDLEAEGQTIGRLAVFSTIPEIYRERNIQILRLAANEFTLIACYLLKLE